MLTADAVAVVKSNAEQPGAAAYYCFCCLQRAIARGARTMTSKERNTGNDSARPNVGEQEPPPNPNPNPNPPLCRRFLVNGSCWGDPANGGDCPFLHAVPAGKTLDDVRSEMTCPFLGRCRYVGKGLCLFSHEDNPYPHRTPKDKKAREKPDDRSVGATDTTDTKSSNRKRSKSKRGKGKSDVSDEEGGSEPCCGVCLEVPLVSGDAKDWARYALLPGCDHVFCIKCIQQWRAANKSANDDGAAREATLDKALVKCCPTCRSPSRFCVPSNKFYKGEAKEEMIMHFKDSKAKKKCRNYVVGKLGSCPFGAECFYLHPDHNGDDMKHRDETAEALFSQRQEAYLNRRIRRRRQQPVDINAVEMRVAAIRDILDLLSLYERNADAGVGIFSAEGIQRALAASGGFPLPPLPPSR